MKTKKKKIIGLCSDQRSSWDSSTMTAKLRDKLKQKQAGRACKYTLAQMIKRGTSFFTFEEAMLKLFYTTVDDLTKKEHKALTFAYNIASAEARSVMKSKLFSDSSFSHNAKVLEEIDNRLRDENDNRAHGFRIKIRQAGK